MENEAKQLGNWLRDVQHLVYSIPSIRGLVAQAGGSTQPTLRYWCPRSELEPPRELQDAVLGRVFKWRDGVRCTPIEMDAHLEGLEKVSRIQTRETARACPHECFE
jgi:hypothetical protein